jgi:hypothetical protein
MSETGVIGGRHRVSKCDNPMRSMPTQPLLSPTEPRSIRNARHVGVTLVIRLNFLIGAEREIHPRLGSGSPRDSDGADSLRSPPLVSEFPTHGVTIAKNGPPRVLFGYIKGRGGEVEATRK